MTTSFSLEHEFPTISLEKFVTHLNDPALNKLLEKELSFDERTMTERKVSKNGDLTWHFMVRKKGELPATLKKIIPSEGLVWEEVSRYVAKEHCIYWEIKPTSKLLKFHGEGSFKLSKSTKGCKRVIEGSVSVQIPLVGKMIEAFIVGELKNTYELEPKIQEKFYNSIS